MALLAAIFLFAGAVSIDSFATGFAVGLGGIRVPAVSRILIVMSAGATLALSMCLGTVLNQFLNPLYSRILAAVMLIVLGLYLFWRSLPSRQKDAPEQEEPQVWQWEIASLGLMIQVLRNPAQADCNADRHLGSGESIMLGIALSLDSFGAGFAMAMNSFPIAEMVFVTMLSNFLFLSLAVWLGGLFINRTGQPMFWQKYVSFLPALVILAMGIWRLGGILWQ